MLICAYAESSANSRARFSASRHPTREQPLGACKRSGSSQQDVFFVDDDRTTYVRLLREQARKYGVRIEAYCLMTNHIHLVATPKRKDSLAKAVGRTHFLYTQYINRMHGRSGHLWQNRFFSCTLDGAHFLNAIRYVERNPVRARIVRAPWRYAWSSAAEHVGASPRIPVLDDQRWRDETDRLDWRDFLTDTDTAAQDANTIRLATTRGRPLASDSLLSKLEKRLRRRLRPLPVGRPRKPDTNSA